MAVFCHPFRVKNDVLAEQLYTATKLPKEIIFKILTTANNEPSSFERKEYDELGVNHPDDSITPREKVTGYTTANSTSEAEVYRFVYNISRFGRYNLPEAERDPKSVIAHELYKIYFGDHPLSERWPLKTQSGIPPHEISPLKFYGPCIDGDTCRVGIFKPNECFEKGIGGFYGWARENQIDSPEKCPETCVREDPITKKCIKKGCLPGIIPEEGKEWTLRKLIDPNFKGEPPQKVKEKLVDNATRVFREMIVPQAYKYTKLSKEALKDLRPDEVFKIIQLIAAWIDYGSTIETTVMNGFINYVQEIRRIPMGTRESTIRFASKDPSGTPYHMCGMWQPYDKYLRRLTLYIVENPNVISDYLNYAFSKDLQQANIICGEKRGLIQELAEGLKLSPHPAVRDVAIKLSAEQLKKPTEIFGNSYLVIQRIHFFLQIHKDYADCWTLVKVLLGLNKDYRKYRSQEYPVFKDAGRLAERFKHGLYSDPTFTALWLYNSRITNYNPRDCLTDEE